MCDDRKPWERPWYPKEIAENASNWTFAADLGLLKYLEVFSEDLLKNASEVDNNVNKLLNNLSKASISLDIAKNDFLSLSNTQFIESRVYEDDETLLSKNEEEKTEEIDTNKNKDEFNKNEMKLAALRGIELIEKYFDKVEVIDSDSEDEDKVTSFVLRPKDPYISRPLPYVIGSEMWYKKPHCGLEESSTESEEEKVSEKYSESDSEDDLPITNRSQAKSISETGSFDVDLGNNMDRPVANSTFNDSIKNDNLESSEDLNSISTQVPTSQDTFAEQLAAKLGNVIRNEVPEAPINTRPIQKTDNYDRYRNIFFDEPPPLDDSDEFSPKSRDQGIFSGGDGLFDDLNDEGIFTSDPYASGDNKTSSQNNYNSNSSKNNSKLIDSVGTKQDATKKLQKSKEPSIFDEDDESDEDFLFNSNKNKEKGQKTQKIFEENPQIPEDRLNQNKEKSSKFFEEDELFKPRHVDKHNPKSDTAKRKALIGGVQVIKNPNLFAGENIKKLLKNRPLSPESSEDEIVSDQVDKTQPPPKELKVDVRDEEIPSKTTQINKNTGLFDDEDDLFSNISAKNMFSSNVFMKKGGLFDDSEEEIEENKENSNTKSNKMKSDGLFDDTDEEKVVQPNLKISIDKNDVFGDLNEVKRSNIEEDSNLPQKVLKNSGLFDNSDEEISKDSLKKSDAKKSFGIFSDDGSDSDDLFSSSKIITKTKIINDRDKIEKSFLEEIAESKKPEKKNTFLFNDDDNEEDDLFSSNFLDKDVSTKQNNISKKNMLYEDVISKVQSSNVAGSRIFRSDDEESLFGSSKNENVSRIVPKSDTRNIKIEDIEKFESKLKNVSDESNLSDQKEIVSKWKNSLEESTINVNTKQIVEEGDEKLKFENYLEANLKLDSKDEENDDLLEDHERLPKERIPSVSIFDPNPPPDDWESNSGHNIFDDDIYSFENNENITGNRSSIFDREPPSVFFDESSGIVRDHIVTRTEDDTTLFNPYASSTRRLSSDLFNEDQSNDSLFTAKRDSTVEIKIPPSILENSEDFTESNLVITLSGRMEDLYSESSEISERNDTQNGSETISKIGEKIEEIEANDKPVLARKSNLKMSNVQKEEFGDGTPGKLKHNLNINVFSLLPGAGPKKVPKKDPPQRSQSLDFNEILEGEKIAKDFAKIPEKVEVPPTNVEVLDSITKNRVKGPGNRRPSSKKARDAIRNSCVDFSFLSTTTIEDNESEVEIIKTPSKSAINDQKTPEVDKLSFKNELISKLSLDKDILKGRKFVKSSKESFKVENISSKSPVKEVNHQENRNNLPKIVLKSPIVDELVKKSTQNELKSPLSPKSPIQIEPRPTIIDELTNKSTQDKQSEIKSPKKENITSKFKNEEIDIFAKTSPISEINLRRDIDKSQKNHTETNKIDITSKSNIEVGARADEKIKISEEIKDDTRNQVKIKEYQSIPKIPRIKSENMTKIDKTREVKQANSSDPPKIPKDETKEVKQTNSSATPPNIPKDETKEVKQTNSSDSPKIPKDETKEVKQTNSSEPPKVPPRNKTKVDKTKEIKQTNTADSLKILKDERKEVKQTNSSDSPKIPKDETKEVKQANSSEPPEIPPRDETKIDKTKEVKQTSTSDPLKILKDETKIDKTKEVKQTSTSDPPKIPKDETKIDKTKEVKQTSTSDPPKIPKDETNIDKTKEVKQTSTSDPPKILKDETKTDKTKEVKQVNTTDPPKILKDETKIDKTAIASKNIDFLSELLGYDEAIGAKNEDTNKIGENSENNHPKSTQSSSNKLFSNSIFNDDPKSESGTIKQRILPQKREKDIFGDDLEDDLDLFSSSSTKKVNKHNLSLPVANENSDFGRRSSFVKTDNFASPEFIKENLSEDEGEDDLFKSTPKSGIFKNSQLDDDDEDDNDEFMPAKIKKPVNTTGIRRLKPSSTLKKLENVPVTGDDPLNAL